MSDFFGDDFTAELKSYFLQSVLQEAERFRDLLDESTFKRVFPDVREQVTSWVVDAKTNEFHALASWMESFAEKTKEFSDFAELVSALEALLGYVGKLAQGEVDTPELAASYSLVAGGKKDSLYLHCKVGVQDFVVPIQYVLEISGPLPVFELPEKQEGLMGVIPFRGEALPVYDLSEFGFQKIATEFYYFVICDYESSRFALQVSETDELLNVNEKELQAKDVSASMSSANFIQSFFIREEKSLMVLDIEKLVAA